MATGYYQSGGGVTPFVELDRPEFDETFIREAQYGFGKWRPKVLQRFASLWGFVALYSPCALWLVTVIQYTRTQISSIERHFKINSFQSGLLMSSVDLGSIFCVVLGSHFGKFYHIPRLLALSAVVAGVAVMAVSLVQVFHPRALPSSHTHDVTEDFPNNTRIKYLCWDYAMFAKYAGVKVSGEVSKGSTEYMTVFEHFLNNDKFTTDDAESMPWSYFWMMGFLFMAGASMSYKIPLQTFYVEQNVRDKSQSGLYMGVMVTAMVFGSPVALFLGAAMNKKSVDLQVTDVPYHDQTWISAWWLGYLVIGVSSILTAIPVFFLPRYIMHGHEEKRDVFKELQYGITKLDYESIPDTKLPDPETPLFVSRPLMGGAMGGATPPGLRATPIFPGDYISALNTEPLDPDETLMDKIRACPKSLKRVLSNSVIVLVLLDGLVTFTGVLGTMAFQLKYFENQFDLSAHTISLALGVGQLCTAVVGTLLGGYLVTKYNMSRADMFKLTFATQLLALCLSVGFVFIGCDNHVIHEFGHSDGANATMQDPCLCADRTLFVCGTDGVNYMSPCHAGCTRLDGLQFRECSAISGLARASPGFCDTGCSTFIPVLLIYVLLVLVGTIGLTPRTLMVVRSVRSDDQALVSGLLNGLCLRMAAVVGPILFGHIYDSACLEWGEEGGACKLSDKEALRWWFLGGGAVIRAVGLVFLLLATVMVHRQDSGEVDSEYAVIPDDGDPDLDSGINGDTPWWLEDADWDLELDDMIGGK